jgi:hypothetical protein
MRLWMARLGACFAAAAWLSLLVLTTSRFDVVPIWLCLPFAGAAITCGVVGWHYPSGRIAFVSGVGAVAIYLVFGYLVYLMFWGWRLD